MKKNLNYLISLFKPTNPLFEKIYSNKTERAELELFVKKVGFEKAEKILLEMPEIMKKDKFMADLSISKPSELNRKFNTLCNAKTRLIKEKKNKAPRVYSHQEEFKPKTPEQIKRNKEHLDKIRESLPWLKQYEK